MRERNGRRREIPPYDMLLRGRGEMGARGGDHDSAAGYNLVKMAIREIMILQHVYFKLFFLNILASILF